MSRAIRFSKAEMEAVQAGLDAFMDLDDDNKAWRVPARHLRTLHAKMVAASTPQATSGSLSPKAFLEALNTVFKPTQIYMAQTDAAYAKLANVLKGNGWSEDDAVELGRSVKKWARGPMNVMTMAVKGPEWLARARATESQPAGGTPQSLFGEDDDE